MATLPVTMLNTPYHRMAQLDDHFKARAGGLSEEEIHAGT